MGTLNLDEERAKRAAKAEKSEGHKVILGGQEFTLPALLPFEFGEACRKATTEAGIRRAVRVILGSEQYERFVEQQVTLDDVGALIDGLAGLYGFESPGESLASSGSSRSNGNRSRPTSKRATNSTSANSAGVNGQPASVVSAPS